MMKAGAMALKTVVPGIPKSAKDRGTSRGGLATDQVPRVDGEALEATNGGDGVGAAE